MVNNPWLQMLQNNSMGSSNNPFMQYLNNSLQQPLKVPQVNGRAGANAYDMPKASEILLMDETDPIIWYVKTDDAGYKTITGLDISIHEDEETRRVATLEERIAKLEEEMKRHREPDYVDVAFSESEASGTTATASKRSTKRERNELP